MTEQLLTPPNPYTIQGTGPYNIGHGYSARADIVAVVVLGVVRTVLVLDTDYFVAPDGDPSDGDVTLSAAAATAYDTGTLYIGRDTAVQQGWQGTQSAREAALEAQLDAMVRALQDARLQVNRSLRLDYDLEAMASVDGQFLSFSGGVPIMATLATTALTVSAFGQTLIDDANAADVHVTLGTYVNALWLDGEAATFGTDGNMRIYHDGTDSFVSAITGDLVFSVPTGQTFRIKSGSVTMAKFFPGSSAELNYNNVRKLRTNIDGVTVTGMLAADTAAGAWLQDDGAFASPAADKVASSESIKAFVDPNSSGSATGYFTLPNGIIIQWGRGTVAGSSNATFSYPTPFISSNFHIVGSGSDGNGYPRLLSLTQYEIFNDDAAAQDISWIAIGR